MTHSKNRFVLTYIGIPNNSYWYTPLFYNKTNKLTVFRRYNRWSMPPRFQIHYNSWIIVCKWNEVSFNEISENFRINITAKKRRCKRNSTNRTPLLDPLFLQNFKTTRWSWQTYLPTPFWEGVRINPDFINKWLFDIFLILCTTEKKLRIFFL